MSDRPRRAASQSVRLIPGTDIVNPAYAKSNTNNIRASKSNATILPSNDPRSGASSSNATKAPATPRPSRLSTQSRSTAAAPLKAPNTPMPSRSRQQTSSRVRQQSVAPEASTTGQSARELNAQQLRTIMNDDEEMREYKRQWQQLNQPRQTMPTRQRIKQEEVAAPSPASLSPASSPTVSPPMEPILPLDPSVGNAVVDQATGTLVTNAQPSALKRIGSSIFNSISRAATAATAVASGSVDTAYMLGKAALTRITDQFISEPSPPQKMYETLTAKSINVYAPFITYEDLSNYEGYLTRQEMDVIIFETMTRKTTAYAIRSMIAAQTLNVASNLLSQRDFRNVQRGFVNAAYILLSAREK